MNSPATRDWVSVTSATLSPDDLTRWVGRSDCGAVVTFCGTVRSTSSTRRDVTSLEYETSEDLAERRIREVVDEARTRWSDLGDVAIHHRIGRVVLGDPAVVVAVSAPHRQAAFDAASFCIDAVKASVPMWKREIWDGGSCWSDEAVGIVSVKDL